MHGSDDPWGGIPLRFSRPAGPCGARTMTMVWGMVLIGMDDEARGSTPLGSAFRFASAD